MIFLHEDPYWQFVSGTRGSQVRVPLLGWLGGWRTELGCRRLRWPRFVNVLPLPCRVSRPGQAEVTRALFPTAQPAWLCLADELWRDTTPRLFVLLSFFFSPLSLSLSLSFHQASQSEQECETLLNSADGSQPSHQLARLHPRHTPVSTWRIPTVRTYVAGCTASCLCFNTTGKSINNVSDLPRHDLPCTA